MSRSLSRRSLVQGSLLGVFATMTNRVDAMEPVKTPGMKIREVKAFQPATPGSPPDWRTQLGQIVVQLETESGLVGIGVGGGGAAGIHVVQTVLRDMLIGRDASAVEELHHDMNRQTLFYGRK